MNPLVAIREFDQSLWLDFISRPILIDGKLQRRITDEALRGVTSNPAIFAKSIGDSTDYDSAIKALALQGKTTDEIYTSLAVADVQQACDLFRPLYDREHTSSDGYVSLEVSPTLVNDTEGTIEEGLRLWKTVDRPNVMIKVPATLEGLPAIRRLIAEGVNVNVTLIFGLERYRLVTEAFLAGLEDRAKAGLPLARIDSVASFFLSRIDVLIDPMLEKIAAEGGEKGALAQSLVGEVALASAKLAYQMYKEIFSGPRWEALQAQGAETQRLLWASTGNKNPKYDDLKYVENLIGPKTVNTVPVETLDIFRERGQPAVRLEEGIDKAREVLRRLPELGINLEEQTNFLEVDGAKKFNEPFGKLMESIEKKRVAAMTQTVVAQDLQLGQYQAAVDAKVQELNDKNFTAGFWDKKADLWVQDEAGQHSIRSYMGWLRVAETMVGRVPEIEQFVHEIKAAGFKHVVVMGMGGSTMAPIVFKAAFEQGPNGLPMSVLDTTDPGTVRQIEASVPLAETLFIVASKSGTTAEPLAFGDYFYAKLKELKGDKAGENFVAITDPGSKFVTDATAAGYRRIFLNFPEVGGRFSALSYFGLVPAALYGLPIGELLERAILMMRACGAYGAVETNPGLELGAALGVLAEQGRDKLTLVVPDSLADLGLWLEQLIAESTGKEGKGILPVAGEPLGDVSIYGNDRVFVYVGYEGQADADNTARLQQLQQAGHPVITILMKDALDLGQEFYRWEVATAVASAVFGINPFDQPNVQAAKTATDGLMKVVEEQGSLPEKSQPVASENGVSYYSAVSGSNASEVLKAFFAQVRPGDFLCLQAYLTETPAVSECLQELRRRVQQALHIATTSGYGPRFLHSTGQYHKGGPDTGLFVQFTDDNPQDLALPGRSYTFGTFKNAQALGDLEALQSYNRRTLRVHLGKDAEAGLKAMLAALPMA
ncbi:bifunctional transaldolase/phosoglucose isomerase [Hymenobacter sp. BT770]|uniref:bifunctional transaldolase/phosoglucose isomerase n=1 Tax=Hymenobacter sp. BT770 TaxID=2886942 RepID=UPI001D1014B6|nr:bifunctional transaldolase/phosoglucose isomerase [Hymenobacter sp. BT770]MCC3154401.1 bifunctional transaldolase/phosoglucose isomerase [Hymenobacter sp. BT770]MDO3416272.1 bifunctional transaldolase/phosoglucose isomerase [Hymenobacter sp. BT770]